MIRIAFFGTPAFAVPFLRALADDAAFEIAAVISQADKPSGRGHAVRPTATKLFAQTRNIPVLQPEKMKTPETLEMLRALRADVFVVVAYGRILPQTLLDLPRLGCVNVHPSLLPRHRGPSPMQAAILNDDQETGVCVMKLDAGMDTGPLLACERLSLAPDETYLSLEARVHRVGAPLLTETLKCYAAGERKPVPQTTDGVTLTRMLTRDDGRIDWTHPAHLIDRARRAYAPWPGAWTMWKDARVKIIDVTLSDRTLASGTVQTDGTHLYVGTGSTALEILKLQIEGSSITDAATFLQGHPDVNGTRWI